MAKSKVTQKSANTGAPHNKNKTSGGSNKERTVPVNPNTYQEDPNSTFRVSESEVGKPPVVASQSSGGSSSSGFVQDKRAESYKQIAKDNASKLNGKVSINPDNVVKSEIAGVNQVAIRGSASKGNFNQTQVVKVAVDSQAVSDYNKDLKERGIENAKDYFQAVAERGAVVQETSRINPNPSKPFNPVAPRSVSLSETTPVKQEFNNQDFGIAKQKEFGGQINAYNPNVAQRSKLGQFGFDFKEDYANYQLKTRSGNELLIFTEPVVSFVAGRVESGMQFIEGGVQIYKEAPKGKDLLNPIKVGSFASKTTFEVIEGTSEFLGEAVEDVKRGDVVAFAGKGTDVFIQGEVGGRIGTGTKNLFKGAFVDFGKELKFSEATGSPKAPYEFFTQKYDIEGRQGVVVPPEYLGALNKQNAPELQTQLYPKKIDGIGQESSIFAPEPYKPQSFMELAKKEPALAKELAKESGQTVFNPEEIPRTRDLTPEERLSIAKEQADAKPLTLQKTLTGYPPKNTEQVFIVKDNKVVAKIKDKQVEIKDTPLFAVDPLTASAITIYQNKEVLLRGPRNVFEKFKRESTLISDSDILEKTKSGSNFVFIIKETRDLIQGQGRDPIIITSISQNIKNQNNQIPNSIIRSKRLQDSNPIQSNLVRSFSRQGQSGVVDVVQQQTQEQIQNVDSALAISQIQIQQTRQVQRTNFDFSSKNNIPENPTVRVFKSPKDKEDSQNGLFAVQVRRRGRFETVGSFSDKLEAFDTGKRFAQNSAVASFRLLDLARGEVVSSDVYSSDFAPSKREKGVYVQKNKFRISSVGEKSEITYKGISSNRRRIKKWAF